MSTQIDLGPVLSIPKGDWNATTTYERLNLVRHNSAAWICNVDTSIGVEPSEDSVDWFLQVKDTSAVSSVNGMRGDVEITTIQTPSNDSDDTSITNTEWVRDRIDETINSIHSYTDNAVSAATASILNTAAQDASSKATTAVNQALAASETKFATIKTVNDLASNINTLVENDAALDAAVVHKTGDETIAGEKTFTGNVAQKGSKPIHSYKNTDVTKGTAPASNKYWDVEFTDKNGNGNTVNRIGTLTASLTPNNLASVVLRAYKAEAGNSDSAILAVQYPASGTPYAVAPSTPANSTGTQIVTADFLQKDQTMAGTKTFTEVVGTKSSFKIAISDFVQGTKPSASRYWHLNLVDVNNTLTGRLQQFINKGGDSCFRLCHKKYDGSKEIFLGCGFDKNGNSYAVAPTPDATSNTTHIATTAWVRGKGVLVESWHSGANWYRKYSDGWIEQGGVIDWSVNGNDGNLVTLHTPFTDKNYVPQLTLNRETDSDQHWGSVGALTTTSFKVFVRWMSTAHKFYWTACGY